MAQIQEKTIQVIKITLNLEEAHQLAMVLDDYITAGRHGKRKKNKDWPAPKVIIELFEYFDGRML